MRPRDAAWTSRPTGPGTSGRGQRTRTPPRPPESPAWYWAATSTRFPTAAPSTVRSGSSRPSRPWTCSGPAGSPPGGRSGSPVSRTRRAPASASPAPDHGCSPAHSTLIVHGRSPTTTARPWPRPCRRPARTRALSAVTRTRSAGSAPSSSCTSSRAAVSWARGTDGAPPSGWPRRSGRTGAGGWTCEGGPTMRGRPGWPTGRTRCRPWRPRSWRPGRPQNATARWRRSESWWCGRTGSTRSPRQ